MAKKNLIRLIKFYDLIDLVSDQAMKRLEHRPDEMSNKDLLLFMTTFLNTIEKTTSTLGTLDDTTTALVINQQNNEINVDMNGAHLLPRESKEKVVDAIKKSNVSTNKDRFSTRDY